MSIIIDKTFLLLYGLFPLFTLPVNASFVLCFFIAICYGSFSCCVTEQKRQVGFCMLYLISMLVFPDSARFLMLPIYDLFRIFFWRHPLFQPEYPISAVSSVPSSPVILLYITFGCLGMLLVRLPIFLTLPQIVFLLFGCALAALLCLRSNRETVLLQKYRRTRDDDTELQLLLEERNRSLLEKQNTEIYTATLRERNRIAREIHDNVGHMLTRAILMVGALRTTHPEPDLAVSLSLLNDTLDQAMNSIRQSVHDLHDSSADLKESLELLIRDFTYCPVSLQYAMQPDIPRELRYSLISIAREALVNIARHSHATQAAITAIEHPGFYQFIIEDNGIGGKVPPIADINTPHTSSGGIGLSNIYTRVAAWNGYLQIQNEHGYRIHITIPKQ